MWELCEGGGVYIVDGSSMVRLLFFCLGFLGLIFLGECLGDC